MACAPPRDLKARYREGRLIPFIGAGVSMAVEWQVEGVQRRGLSWSELVDHAARLLDFDDPDLLHVRGSDLQILEYYRLKQPNDFADLQNWYFSEYKAPDTAIESSRLHTALSNLDRCRLYYTTNYDDYLERSLELHGRSCDVVAVEAHIARALKAAQGRPNERPEVVKFHGDLANPSRMVLSERDYEARLSFAQVEDQRLRSDVLGRAVLFLGYSFRDWNVSYLFRLINEQFGELPDAPTGWRAYITVADPSDFEYELFQARNISVIPIRGTSRTEDTAALLEQLAAP